MALVEFVVFHPWKALTVLVVGALVGLASFYTYQVNTAFGAVASEDFDPGQARSAMEAAPDAYTDSEIEFYEQPAYDLEAEMERISDHISDLGESAEFNSAAFGEPIDDSVFESYLLIGTDASGFLADVVILALQPSDGSSPIMVSLPRDLFVWNLCEQTFTRLNSGLGGCSSVASGSELMAIMVEDYTGVPIDHLARIDFDGFSRLVDVMGGITVCVDHPTRDAKAHLELQRAGCQVVGGETALAWVRSRHPEQLIDGVWKTVAGSDFTRQGHQQDVLFQLAGKAAAFSSPATLTDRLAAVSSSVRLDSAWSLSEAAAAGWRYRGISKDSVSRFPISVTDYRTSYGASVLLPTRPFADQLEEVYELG
jgi:LCP family protein required for cell wall assembly